MFASLLVAALVAAPETVPCLSEPYPPIGQIQSGWTIDEASDLTADIHSPYVTDYQAANLWPIDLSGGGASLSVGSKSGGEGEDGLNHTHGNSIIRGRYLRAAGLGQLNNRGYYQITGVLVEGWLLDGSWGSFQLNFTPRRFTAEMFVWGCSDVSTWLRTYVQVDRGEFQVPSMITPDGDDTYDIEDLNLVRNNFGGQGEGDADGDGNVGISDLNFVRNNFGSSSMPFKLPAFTEVPDGYADVVRHRVIGSGSGGSYVDARSFPPDTLPVPEPSSTALLAITTLALVLRARRS